MLFETKHSARVDLCHIDPPAITDGFPLHLHEMLEAYLVTKGEVRVTVDDDVYLLGEGEGVLVFPYQRHSYKVIEDAEILCCLFSPDFAPAYTKDKGKLLPQNARFSFPAARLPMRDGYLAKKAFVYDLLSTFDENREYIPRKMDGQSSLISRILIYLSENLAGDCSLHGVAEKVGYEYTYLSKYFKRMTGVSLHAYTDALRIARAKDLLTAEPRLPVHLIGERCGYPSHRTLTAPSPVPRG
jgi:AraC-like DNA-binding protein